MRVHFVGIKGVGVAGIATLFKEWGSDVSGSDTAEGFFTDRILAELGVRILPFDEKNITKDIDRVIYSTAYTEENPEIRKAKAIGVRTQSYTEALAEIFNARNGIIVTGSHGKTTTTAMLGRILEDAGWDPTVLVGGEVLEWGRTARDGKSEWMVIEGDEYQAKILEMRPRALLITNVDYDHPDFYKTKKDYEEVFKKVVANMPKDGIVVQGPFNAGELGSARLKVFGEHNKINAVGAMKMALALGVPKKTIKKSLENFRGTRRRLEFYTAEDAPLVAIDDYAHHPAEIRASLGAIRKKYFSRRIVAIFQPHTFSRTKAFLEDFAGAFEDADSVVLTCVYGSAREGAGEIGAEDLVDAMRKKHSDANFAKNITDAAELAINLARGNSVIVTLGAGDIWKAARIVAAKAQS